MDNIVGKTADDCSAEIWKSLRKIDDTQSPTEQRRALRTLVARYMSGLAKEVQAQTIQANDRR